ncbi:hypothetical protein [Bradyrhizobium sp. LHD-71]|uniref:hypothetical protein n=1 Tax=Bradyrhizobium sp. LHD-71 TaxID=3072141 RepID=UPI00280ED0DD|nr:hypothetical protein [Bradyrhizobium sp. LHD-71]MDQ8731818.1 hypothetical protein [Bradyrhizobium sp. LHD-71]
MTNDFAAEACIALVSVELEHSRDVTTYIVGCQTPDEAKALVLQEYDSEPDIKIFASKLSAADARELQLRPREIRPWH